MALQSTATPGPTCSSLGRHAGRDSRSAIGVASIGQPPWLLGDSGAVSSATTASGDQQRLRA